MPATYAHAPRVVEHDEASGGEMGLRPLQGLRSSAAIDDDQIEQPTDVIDRRNVAGEVQALVTSPFRGDVGVLARRRGHHKEPRTARSSGIRHPVGEHRVMLHAVDLTGPPGQPHRARSRSVLEHPGLPAQGAEVTRHLVNGSERPPRRVEADHPLEVVYGEERTDVSASGPGTGFEGGGETDSVRQATEHTYGGDIGRPDQFTTPTVSATRSFREGRAAVRWSMSSARMPTEIIWTATTSKSTPNVSRGRVPMGRSVKSHTPLK